MLVPYAVLRLQKLLVMVMAMVVQHVPLRLQLMVVVVLLVMVACG
jgi:hypothetical protein